MRNLYQGNIVLDAAGQAVVTLPDYFDALNADTEFNYQMTCIRGFAPGYIAEKVSGNPFKIAGGVAGLEVSWQVTAIRNDPYLRDHPVQAEVNSARTKRGHTSIRRLWPAGNRGCQLPTHGRDLSRRSSASGEAKEPYHVRET